MNSFLCVLNNYNLIKNFLLKFKNVYDVLKSKKIALIRNTYSYIKKI